jgi:hypothetical protein
MGAAIFATDYMINLKMFIIAAVSTCSTIALKHKLFVRSVSTAIKFI